MTSHTSEELGPDHRNEPPGGKKRRHDVARQVCSVMCIAAMASLICK